MMDRHGGNNTLSETLSTQRRRHSSYQPIRESSYEIDAEAVFVKVRRPTRQFRASADILER